MLPSSTRAIQALVRTGRSSSTLSRSALDTKYAHSGQSGDHQPWPQLPNLPLPERSPFRSSRAKKRQHSLRFVTRGRSLVATVGARAVRQPLRSVMALGCGTSSWGRLVPHSPTIDAIARLAAAHMKPALTKAAGSARASTHRRWATSHPQPFLVHSHILTLCMLPRRLSCTRHAPSIAPQSLVPVAQCNPTDELKRCEVEVHGTHGAEKCAAPHVVVSYARSRELPCAMRTMRAQGTAACPAQVYVCRVLPVLGRTGTRRRPPPTSHLHTRKHRASVHTCQTFTEPTRANARRLHHGGVPFGASVQSVQGDSASALCRVVATGH